MQQPFEATLQEKSNLSLGSEALISREAKIPDMNLQQANKKWLLTLKQFVP